jgi:hypothetical protein
MDAERWLRPRGRVAVLATGFISGGLWVFFAAFTAYAAVWWPEHKILENTPGEWLLGSILLSSFFSLPIVGAWLWIRRVTWHVGAGGITVFRRGTPRRSFDWPDITTLIIMPCYAVARSVDHPLGSEIPFLAADDVSWLREFARKRLGERLVS